MRRHKASSLFSRIKELKTDISLARTPLADVGRTVFLCVSLPLLHVTWEVFPGSFHSGFMHTINNRLAIARAFCGSA